MTQYNVAVIPGDGIGPEVVSEGIKVLQAVSKINDFTWQFKEYPWGSDYYFKSGSMMPSDALTKLSTHNQIFLGAVGHPELQDHVTLNGLLLPIRRTFDQYVCERPSVLYPGVNSYLRNKSAWDIDMVVVRENTEGEYANIGGFLYKNFAEELGVQTSVFTKKGCERVITHAFKLAHQRGGKRKVTSVTKSNAQGYGMVVWDQAFESVASKYPDILTESLLVDAACMDFIRRPEDFDVVVASNLFGDILTDIGAIITGSIGLAPSGNIDPEHRYPSMFEPVHGSAPELAGKGVANPLATILAGAMMLDHLGERTARHQVQEAVSMVLAQETTTPDLGGTYTTSQVADAVVAALR